MEIAVVEESEIAVVDASNIMLMGKSYRIVDECKLVIFSSPSPYNISSCTIDLRYFIHMPCRYDDI